MVRTATPPYRLRLSILILLCVSPPLEARGQEAVEETRPVTRRTKVVEGITFTYPVDEEDVVEKLIPRVVQWKNDQQSQIEKGVEGIFNDISADEGQVALSKYLAWTFAQEMIDPRLSEAHRSALVDALRLAGAWRRWRAGFHEVNLWSFAEARERYDEKKDRIIYQDLQFDDRARSIEFSTSFLNGIKEVSALPKATAPIEPLQIDIPLLYRPGTSRDKVLAFCTEVLQKIGEQAPRLLAEIRKTPLKRVNMENVYAAYLRLTGKDLKTVLTSVLEREDSASKRER